MPPDMLSQWKENIENVQVVCMYKDVRIINLLLKMLCTYHSRGGATGEGSMVQAERNININICIGWEIYITMQEKRAMDMHVYIYMHTDKKLQHQCRPWPFCYAIDDRATKCHPSLSDSHVHDRHDIHDMHDIHVIHVIYTYIKSHSRGKVACLPILASR